MENLVSLLLLLFYLLCAYSVLAGLAAALVCLVTNTVTFRARVQPNAGKSPTQTVGALEYRAKKSRLNGGGWRL